MIWNLNNARRFSYMELIEDLFRLWWHLFLSLSTFSKVFIIIFFGTVSIGIIAKTLEEQKIREGKLKAIKKEEKKEEKEKIDDFLLKP